MKECNNLHTFTNTPHACMAAPRAAAASQSGATGVTWNTDSSARWTPGMCEQPPTITTSPRSADTTLVCLQPQGSTNNITSCRLTLAFHAAPVRLQVLIV